MGNSHGIPASSNDEWVVLPLPVTCGSRCGGALVIPPDHDADARLVDDGPPLASRGEVRRDGVGLVPRRDYDEKIRGFNAVVGGGRRGMMLVFWVGIAFVLVVPNVLRFLGRDIEVWMYSVAAYVPVTFLLAYTCYYYHVERGKVKALFEPWRTRYGIESEWFGGTKHEAPRLGFRLPRRKLSPSPAHDGRMVTIPLGTPEDGGLRAQLAV